MKLIINLLFCLFLLTNSSLFALAESDEMCNCIEMALKTTDAEKKRECLNMQEKHVKKLKKGSKLYKEYKQTVNECEINLANNSQEIPKEFDAQKEEVCNCFSTSKSPAKCFQMQSKFANTQGERKTEFIQATNSCAK